ncbi:MAG: succinate dehydrogenase, hydrophobic membrane anchor protein [Kiloniellales bacterium]|jgi:succinate dehydrogenase / fumarate reductase membrane anchor subunit
MGMRSPLRRALGLGSAKEGTGQWWAERMSALALVPLTVWFVASLVAMAGADYYALRDWMGSPVVAALLILLVFVTFYHGALALQVIIEDYVHYRPAKFAGLIAVKAAAVLLALTGVLSVLLVLFTA